MWVKSHPNRQIYEREKIKDHLLHVQRLRAIKPVIDIKKPPKPSHMQVNYKKEMLKRER